MLIAWDRLGALPKSPIFVEVPRKKAPLVHGGRAQVTVFDRDPLRGCVVSVARSFGFMEDPNVERVLEDLAGTTRSTCRQTRVGGRCTPRERTS